MLKGKCVILGVSGGIAAYKIATLASMLKKAGCDIHVIMTQNATNFITPLTFETLTGNKCIVDTFDRDFEFDVKHISLAKKADIIVVAPATANVIAKIAHGIADDMLTTTILASRAPKLVVPAMNTNMYNNQITQDNLSTLTSYGIHTIMPAEGLLACGDVGAGKMPEPEELFAHIERLIAFDKDMVGKKVLVTAGPTREALDPVRYITNHSTGKMGFAIAKMCMLRGAEVILVSGKTNIAPPLCVKVIDVNSAEDMYNAVTENYKEMDYIFKAAAVADYTPLTVADNKIKKKDGDMAIPLARTKDILKFIGENKMPGQIICGFSMETENMIENSKTKLVKKNIDMIIANNLKVAGAGFGTDTNIVTIITNNKTEELPIMSKESVANRIIDAAIEIGKQ